MTTQDLDRMIERVKAAGQAYSRFTQKQVDYIFREAAMAANSHRIDLAVLAQTETGMGIIEDKVIKNHFASEFIYNKHRDAVTCGIIEEDEGSGIKKIAEPLGVICGVIPTTNPTSTAIFKALLALKTRNAIIFSPHPRAKECTAKAAEIIREAAVSAGAPEDIVACITEPSLELTQGLMQHKETALILATGGPGMVKAAYSSGKPAIGVGPGNTPALIDETADIKMAVNSVILSKTFDHGVICASEQSLIVHKDVLTEVKNELKARGAYLVKKAELPKLRDIILQKEKMVINPKIVGQSAMSIAAMAGIKVPPKTKVLVGEVAEVDVSDPLAHEKLSPILALYPCADFEAGVDMARQLIELGGFGHTSVIYTDPNNDSRIGRFGEVAKTGRILVNMPSSQGAIGDIYNFRLEPSLTLGCGSWGGNSVSENVGVKHLLNIKTLAERRENMLWFRIPNKIFHKYGCLPLALKELEGKKRAFIVTDGYLFEHGYADRVTDVLEELGIESQVFSAVKPDPTLASVYEGA
jgi:acetaldehyde dehydrogenase/alcohol dehydrogenase